MRKRLFYCAVVVSYFSAIEVLALHPREAEALVANAVGTFKCATAQSCLVASNSKTGAAITASSAHGDGIVASSNTQVGLYASTAATGSGIGVAGIDDTNYPNIGVYGASNNGVGVKAISGTGIAVEGSSGSAYGVEGSTANASGDSAGVIGLDNSQTGTNSGVTGISTEGRGVTAFADLGDAVFAQATNAGIVALSTGQIGHAGTAVYAGNVGIGAGLVASSIQGPVMAGFNGNQNQEVMSLDISGNEILAGSLTQSGQPTIRTKTSSGTTLTTYGDRTSSPAVEDLGEARLASGYAYVALEPTFAATIDKRAKYMVFLQPQGDSRGLYVTSISDRGFAVRESNGGRSTLAFDYRIVAKPYDSDAARLSRTAEFAGLAYGSKLQAPIPRSKFPRAAPGLRQFGM